MSQDHFLSLPTPVIIHPIASIGAVSLFLVFPAEATPAVEEWANSASSGHGEPKSASFQAIIQTPLRPSLLRPVCLPAAVYQVGIGGAMDGRVASWPICGNRKPGGSRDTPLLRLDHGHSENVPLARNTAFRESEPRRAGTDAYAV